jgi:Tfp pilus assembly protein PilF
LATLDDLEGRPEAALVSFRKAMDRDPHDPEVANLFIQFLTKYGHDTLARAVYERHAQARGVPDPRVAVP